MMHGPPLASESSGCTPSTRTYSAGSTLGSTRGSSAHSHRRIRHELNYPATTEWAFLKNTPQTIDKRHQYRPVQPSRPSTARDSATSETIKLPQRPATSRGIKSQIRNHEQLELLTPRNASLVIQEAVRREQNQEDYVDPLIGRSVEPRGQLGRDGKTSSDGVETKTIELLSRARVVTTAAMNATERLRLRAFQSRANGEYDRAIKFYTRLSTARPNESEAKFHLAVCLERTGQFAPALAAYKQVQKLAGGQHAFAYYNMGNLCMRAEKIPQAIDYFTRAINASKKNDSTANHDRVQSSSSNTGSTPVVFYRQRAAAYRKNGDFEKAARDYVHVQKCAEGMSSTTLADESAMYTDERLYQTVKRAVSPRKAHPKTLISDDEDELSKELDIDAQSPNQDDELQSEEEEVEDALTAWTLRRCFEIARLPPCERSESDLQCLTDFMQKRFLVCAALHPAVCKLLCRELILSPEGALPARTPIFMEQDECADDTPRDHTLYFIFQGRVSASKTAGRMFQPSLQRTDSPEEDLEETQEDFDEDRRHEEEITWESPWNTCRTLVSTEWKQSQLELYDLERGDIFGHQGRFTNAPRLFSRDNDILYHGNNGVKLTVHNTMQR
ncbi:Hypothetical protein PHPALM_20173 [Phytophthora palmivora]|uniref:Uncharacterized protein n=1 Tax=Phytophthora palmivora TaxID=4796 RepID=A0A2P4XFH8_9STRA|nr:Hypothetical protein PHPALM_20173 [Phytophthora palmivora]